MRLEPVYLLAPKPKPPSMPTRRAILIAGSTFVAGFGVGGACGYAAGSRVAPAGESTSEPELQPSGDADLDELRRLAVKAPIEELMQNAVVFANLVRATYRDDEILWRGMDRIAAALISGYQIPDRRKAAIWIAQVIEGAASSFARPLLPRAESLRRIK